MKESILRRTNFDSFKLLLISEKTDNSDLQIELQPFCDLSFEDSWFLKNYECHFYTNVNFSF